MERRYALVFRGHDFGYEVQAVAKIFIPGVRFLIVTDGTVPDVPNVIETSFSTPGEPFQMSICSVNVRLHGKHLNRTKCVEQGYTRESQERILCTMLYEVLQELTGYTPPWGMLTGIRPVRKILQALDAGMTPEEAASQMRAQYRVSEEKLRLAVDTALVQQPILPHSPREIGLYISIPFCPTRCSYCSFVSHSMETAKALIPDYIGRLCEEIAVYGEILPAYGLTVQSVYIGGGTPTAISAEELRRVMEAIAAHIDLHSAREYTVEAGRADTITAEKLAVIKEMGATRISVNPQTLQDSVLEAIGRCHTAQQAVDAFRLAREMGFDDINMDLIAGLPTDTYEGFADTLRRVMALAPDSITIHTLTIKRSATLYHGEHEQSAAISEIEQMAELSAKTLPANGWRPYYLYRQKNTLGNLENVGYAKPGKENLYNILIMDETQTILGAGCGASTKVVLPDGDITRILNYKFPYEYIGRFDTMMEKKHQLREVLSRLVSEVQDAEK